MDGKKSSSFSSRVFTITVVTYKFSVVPTIYDFVKPTEHIFEPDRLFPFEEKRFASNKLQVFPVDIFKVRLYIFRPEKSSNIPAEKTLDRTSSFSSRSPLNLSMEKFHHNRCVEMECEETVVSRLHKVNLNTDFRFPTPSA